MRPVYEASLPGPETISLLSSDDDSDSAQRQTERPSKRPRHAQHSPPPSPHHEHLFYYDLGPRGGVHYPETSIQLPVNQALGSMDDVVVSDTGRIGVDGGRDEGDISWKTGWNPDWTQTTGGTAPVPSTVASGTFPASSNPESGLGSEPGSQAGSQAGPQYAHQDDAHHEPPPIRIPIKEPQLCPEQAELVDIILSGQNVFYTGSAGCGKSTVLKEFTRRLRDLGLRVDIVAPTGISALNVGGATIFVYAGWGLNSIKQPLDKLRRAAHARNVRKRLRDTDVLVIDEISSKSRSAKLHSCASHFQEYKDSCLG